MLEQASRSFNGNYEQSTILQLSWDCIYRAVEPITEFVSVRERSKHSEDNQTLILRDVDPAAYDGVWAIIHDGCNSHNRAWRQNAVAKMKVLEEGARIMESRTFPWAFFKMLCPCPGHACRYQTICCLRFHFLLFTGRGLGSQWMSQTHDPRLLLRTPMNMALCGSFYVTHILACAWRRYLMKKKHATKMRFIVLKVIPICIIPDTQTRLSDGRSGLTLFPSQLTCQAPHKTEVSSACGYELYFWCALRSSVYLLLDGPKAWWHLQSGHLTTLYTTITCVTFFWTILSSVLVLRPTLTMLLEVRINSVHSIVSHAMVGDSRRIFPRSEIEDDTIIVSCRLAKFELISWRDATLSRN